MLYFFVRDIHVQVSRQGGVNLARGRGETQRVDIRVPTELLREIEKYQDEEMIRDRTAAMLELIRKGLNASKNAEK